ncbi:MAG: methionine ABC transporter ATP-binding protein [Catenisphaera adipataccumulans]|uniref:methionine ABC transporter ATP-binding protein n=1 Tax=Catenisphaera adipataccumulans TaxID=700500 RepID=UPI003D909449
MIRLEHVSKTFQTKAGKVHAVQDVSLDIPEGDIFGIIGFSGAGKSTLVRCMNLLEKPDTGAVYLEGQDLLKLNDKQLRRERQKMGMIFQHFNLMESRTVFDNIAMPLVHLHWDKAKITARVNELLELIDLVDRGDSYPSQLSGGQKQRVAIARALANDPKVLLCDEATSALDPQTTQNILALIRKVNQSMHLTVVIITHEMAVVKEVCNHVAVMEEGKIVEQGDIVSVFTNPQQEITKNFINTTNNARKIDELIEQDHPITRLQADQVLVRLQYKSANTADPIISTVSRKFDVDINLIFANVEIVHDTPIGQIEAIFTGKEADVQKALDHFRNSGVRVEVIKCGSLLS